METKKVREVVSPGLEPDHPVGQDSDKPATGQELLQALIQSGFIGAWKDRDDIIDSAEFARQLRERAQARASD